MVDLNMVLVRDLIGQPGDAGTVALLFEEAIAVAQADAGLAVDPPIVRADVLVPTRYAGFEVGEYVVVDGRPLEASGLVMQPRPVVGVGSLEQMATFPDPAEVNVLATYRWLPKPWTLDPFCTWWVPYSGYDPPLTKGLTVAQLRDQVGALRQAALWSVKDFVQDGWFRVRPVTQMSFDSSPGVNPVLLPRYAYWRAGSYVRSPAVSMRRGAHMWTDEVNWNAQEVTVIVVAVVHPPAGEWFGLLETEAPNLQGLDPFFGVRFHRSGALCLWADAVLASTDVSAGVTRPDQPIAFGMNIDMVNNTIALLSVDEVVRVQTTALPRRYDNRSRLWLGRSPFGRDAAAAIDVLDVGYWERQFTESELRGLLAGYDRMYGVTS